MDIQYTTHLQVYSLVKLDMHTHEAIITIRSEPVGLKSFLVPLISALTYLPISWQTVCFLSL